MSETAARVSEWGLPSAGASRGSSAATCASQIPAPAEAVLSSRSELLVLVVEDDATARIALSRLLRRHGFAVLEAATLSEATSRLDQRPDWILLDLMLPDGCGLDVLRNVPAQVSPAQVCVITGCGQAMLE